VVALRLSAGTLAPGFDLGGGMTREISLSLDYLSAGGIVRT